MCEIARVSQFDIWREIFSFTFGFDDIRFYVIIAIFILTSIIYVCFKENKIYTPPPCCKGWIPFIGCAIEFGKNPLAFFGQKMEEVCKLEKFYS